MTELATRTIMLNFKRVSKETVDAMGIATLGIEEHSQPEQNPRQFMNTEELKAMKQCEDDLQRVQDQRDKLQEELKQEEKTSFFGRMKSTLTGRKEGIQIKMDSVNDATAEIHARMDKLAKRAHMRAKNDKEAAEKMAMLNAGNSTATFLPGVPLPPSP